MSEPLPAALASAHEAMLDGRHDEFLRQIVAVLSDGSSDELVIKSAESMVEAAFKDGQGIIPASLHVPSGLAKLQISQRLLEQKGKVFYIVEVEGQGNPSQIESLALTQFPDRLVVGTREDRLEHRKDSFWVKRAYDAPLRDGLYRVSVKMKDGGMLDAWIPVCDWLLSDAPRIIRPRQDESVFTGTPTIEWRPIEADDASFQKVRLRAEAVHNDAPDWAWDVKWWVDGDLSSATTYVIGRDGSGVSALGKGRHNLNVIYQRVRKIGELGISSESNGRADFYVR